MNNIRINNNNIKTRIKRKAVNLTPFDERQDTKQLYFCKLANVLLYLYAISIYIWSDGADTVVYSTILCFAAMAAMLYVVVTTRDFYIPGVFAALISFNMVCLLSILWAVRTGNATTMATRTLPLLTLFALILYNYIDSIGDTHVLLNAIYIAGVVLAAYTIYIEGGIAGYMSRLMSGVRVGEEVNNVNTIGLGTGISSIIAFYLTISKKKPWHLLCLILCGFVSLGTGSNKALLVIVLGCLLVMLFDSYSSGSLVSLVRFLLGISLVVGAFLFLLQLPIFETINTRFQDLIQAYLGNSQADNSIRTRNALVVAGLAQFFEAPLLGIGINNGSVVAMQTVGHDYYLHNNYVELLVDVGIIGTALFYALPIASLIVCLRKVRNGNSDAIVVVAVMLAWLIVQWGYVAYYSKPTYLYYALFAAAAYPSGVPLRHRRSPTSPRKRV